MAHVLVRFCGLALWPCPYASANTYFCSATSSATTIIYACACKFHLSNILTCTNTCTNLQMRDRSTRPQIQHAFLPIALTGLSTHARSLPLD